MAEDLIRFIPSKNSPAQISIDCAHRAAAPINRRLFGKFTEHLGRNIYNGMWAQILQNTSFVDWSYFQSILTGEASRHAQAFPIDRLQAAYERGLACWWMPYGSSEAAYLIDWIDPFNSRTSQRINLPPGVPESGIAQAIYLPVHRIHTYTASFHARGRADSLRVSLVEGSETLAESTVSGIESDWKPFTAKLTVPEGAVASGAPVEFRIGLLGGGQVWLDQAFLFPDDHISGFDPDVIRLLREARLPLLRYPGGNFASGYHWTHGVGPLHKRWVHPNPAWNTLEPNHVGTDEFVAFCQAVDCEPMICVNAGNGTAEEAARWVEYCNGDTNTHNGNLRAQNGHPEPYHVRYWEIGNELYGSWQIGHCTPEEYAERYDAFQTAMRAADPGIDLIANGQSLDWNGPLVERKGKNIRSLSLHTLTGGRARDEKDPEQVFHALMAHTAAYDTHLRALLDQASPQNPDVKIAITELQIFTNTPHLPNNATQAESLFLAGTIHSALRQDDRIEMITHSALVNHGGGLRKEREIVYPNPVHWVSHLYGNLPEATLVKSVITGPTFASDLETIAAGTDFPALDIIAALGQDQLIVLALNRHPTEPLEAVVKIEGFSTRPQAKMQTISGESYMAKNTWDRPDTVEIEETSIRVGGSPFRVAFSSHSVNALILDRL